MATQAISRPLTAAELGELVEALLRPTALLELALIAGCLGLAWMLARALRGARARPASIWFGDRLYDGALFPALALLLILLARWIVAMFFSAEVPIAVFHIAVPVLMSLALIRLTARVLGVSFPHSGAMRVVERSVSWLAWIAVVLWILGLLPLLLNELDAYSWNIGNARVTVRNLLEGIVSAVLVLMVALWLSAMLEARLLHGATQNLSVRKMAANALRALLLFVGLVIALSAAGIDLTALGVLGGALGVGIGFGLQKLAANYISGFVILAEQSMRIGDMVKVDGFEGRITDISTRYTVIRAINGRESVVPNEMLITQRVENLSLADPRVALKTTVQVAYGTDLDRLLPRLALTVGAAPRVLAEPGPVVQLSAFGADGFDLSIVFWIADPHAGTGQVISEVNLAIWRALRDDGVEIPFPQRVLHQAPVNPASISPAPADVRPAGASES